VTAGPRPLFVDHAGVLGGAELTLLALARRYRDRSTVLLLSDGPFREALVASGVPVSVVAAQSRFTRIRRDGRWPGFRALLGIVPLAWRVARLARRHDAVHANSQKAFVVACLASLLARRPLVWGLHDVLSTDHFSAFNIAVAVGLANLCADRVIANSQASARSLVEHGGRPDRIRVVYNGIDPTPFDAVTPAEVVEARRELRLEGLPVIAVFGRLAEWKGQHVAIRALTELPGIHLLLVGDALFGEHAYADGLRAEAEQLGVASRVHFLGFRADVPRLMKMVSVVVHTSTAPEPFGRVIVEGMMAERPVVATKGGGVDEIIEDGVSGITLAPGQPAILATALRGLLDDPTRAARMAAAGRAVAVARFHLDVMVREMSRQLEDLGPR
jgi:glycosyltransferase involved in cell wall biosynthesis